MKKNNENDEINKKLLIESQVLQKLLIHLQKRTDVQNIDLMNLSGFCRNCLSRWYSEAASENGVHGVGRRAGQPDKPPRYVGRDGRRRSPEPPCLAPPPPAPRLERALWRAG